MKGQMFYFAYGSNMSSRRLRRRVPSAEKYQTGILVNHKLAFHKVSDKDGSAKCDIQAVDDSTAFVYGVVYEILETEKFNLDLAEGLGFGYEVKSVPIRCSAGTQIDAFTYFATAIDTRLQPYHWYKHHVVFGAKENALPAEYIETIESFASIPDPDEVRASSEMALYR